MRDQWGVPVVHAAALQDLQDLDQLLLLTGTFFVRKHEAKSPVGAAKADRARVVLDLYEAEELLLGAKRMLLQNYLHIYDLTRDRDHRASLRQRMVDVIAHRVPVDLTEPYFQDAYKFGVKTLALRAVLLHAISDDALQCEHAVRKSAMKHARKVVAKVRKAGVADFGEKDLAREGREIAHPFEGYPVDAGQNFTWRPARRKNDGSEDSQDTATWRSDLPSSPCYPTTRGRRAVRCPPTDPPRGPCASEAAPNGPVWESTSA